MHDDPARFFPTVDVSLARELLGLSLQGRWREARAAEPGLTVDGTTLLELALALHGARAPRIAVPLRTMTRERAADLASLSPSESLGERPVKAFLLHGTPDPIVPATEALWLSAQLGADATTLVTSAIRHAEGAEGASWNDKLRLVHFLAGVFSAIG